jgi:hypothetical protein
MQDTDSAGPARRGSGKTTLNLTGCAPADEDTPKLSKPVTLADPTPTDAVPLIRQNFNDACPHCEGPSGAPNLLTSMTRYYVCGRCGERWQVGRNWQRTSD